jgi:hypothetical protein
MCHENKYGGTSKRIYFNCAINWQKTKWMLVVETAYSLYWYIMPLLKSDCSWRKRMVEDETQRSRISSMKNTLRSR